MFYTNISFKRTIVKTTCALPWFTSIFFFTLKGTGITIYSLPLTLEVHFDYHSSQIIVQELLISFKIHTWRAHNRTGRGGRGPKDHPSIQALQYIPLQNQRTRAIPLNGWFKINISSSKNSKRNGSHSPFLTNPQVDAIVS